MTRTERKLKHLNEKIQTKASLRGERSAGSKEKRWRLQAEKFKAPTTPTTPAE